MQDPTIALHIGAPFTDNDLLVRSMRKDTPVLIERGVLTRRPGLYKNVITELIEKQATGIVTEAEKAALLARMLKGRSPSRLVLSMANTPGNPAWMLHGGRLFQNAGRNTGELRDLFPANRCELFLGIANPATLIPEVHAAQGTRSWEEFLSGADLRDLRWSGVIRDIIEDCPDCPITVWCNEETPLTWPRILGSLSGLGDTFQFSGELDVIGQLMPELGTKRLADYLAERQHFSAQQKAQVKAVFLEKLHTEDAVDVEIDLPGWSQDLVDAMSETYLDDIGEIRAMPEVTFIS